MHPRRRSADQHEFLPAIAHCAIVEIAVPFGADFREQFVVVGHVARSAPPTWNPPGHAGIRRRLRQRARDVVARRRQKKPLLRSTPGHSWCSSAQSRAGWRGRRARPA